MFSWFLTWKLVESAKWLWLLITINHLLTFYQNLQFPAISKQVEWAFEVRYLFYFN